MTNRESAQNLGFIPGLGEDNTDDSDKPYVVTESRFQVKQLQPIKIDGISNKHAVYISLPLEKVITTYDRNADDPRLAHELTLEIDDFGNVTKSASIAYPRLYGVETDPDHCKEQYQLKIIYTENEVFNQKELNSDWYVKGVPLSAKSFEIESLTQTQSYPPFFDIDELRNDIPSATKKLLSAQVNFYRKDDDANKLNPAKTDFGAVESLLLPYGTYQLIFTNEILNDAYSDKLTKSKWEALLVKEEYLKDNLPTAIDPITGNPIKVQSGWWVTNGFAQYDPDNFYTTNKVKDTWGNLSKVTFDDIGLLPIKVEDPLHNIITADYDYRILQPLRITDPNGNRQEVAYDGFGRVIRTAIIGKNGEGDLLDQKNARNAFNKSDTETSIIEYHHREFYDNGKPNYVHTYTRETHFKDLKTGEKSRWMEARMYSDGFGRELQSKAKVAPGLAYYVEIGNLETIDPNTDEGKEWYKKGGKRWLGTGRTIYDNKGQAVKQFEPYFSTTAEYENEDELVMWGHSPFIHYDAIGRVYRTDMPDGTFTKVEFTPWMQKSFDANDTTILNGQYSKWYKDRITLPSTNPNHIAAIKSAVHKETPSVQITDVLGRPVITKAHNKDAVNALDEIYETKVILDTVGNQLQVIDANGNDASIVVYDLVGRPLKSISNDAGISYALLTIDNQPALAWLPNGHQTKMEYDKFRRPKYLWLQEAGSGTFIIKEATIYGETHPDVDKTNMRGQVWKSYDQAGIAEVNAYDFKGAPLKSTRNLFDDYNLKGDWTELQNANPNLPASNEFFETSIEYDALGRPIKSFAPDGSITENTYDEGGALYKVESTINGQNKTTQVEKIEYNEKGQRKFITYGNGAHTTYHYDEKSYRLTRLHTMRKLPDDSMEDIHDVFYTYDAIGNIVEMFDEVQLTQFFNNQQVEPKQQFVYDGLNRLIEASGREHIGQTYNGNLNNSSKATDHEIPVNPPNSNDNTALQNYKQKYTYDKVGNITEWKHVAASNGYTRKYTYEYEQSGQNSNRLKFTYFNKTNTQAKSTEYNYDYAGNISQLQNHIEDTVWNFENQPTKMTFAQNKIAHYRYDAGGERLRKVIENGNNIRKERIYLGNYELYREYKNGVLEKERTTFHIADDTGRICIQEWLTTESEQEIPTTNYDITQRYQLSNHLGSVGIELDKDANIISYEEYHPYGTTAYYWKSTTISQKRYGYTGKERDVESGLSYHSARYYMPWLGRWLSADPIINYAFTKAKPKRKLKQGTRNNLQEIANRLILRSLYEYCEGNPINRKDNNGLDSGGPNRRRRRAMRRMGIRKYNKGGMLKRIGRGLKNVGKNISDGIDSLASGIKNGARKVGRGIRSFFNNHEFIGFDWWYKPWGKLDFNLFGYRITSRQHRESTRKWFPFHIEKTPKLKRRRSFQVDSDRFGISIGLRIGNFVLYDIKLGRTAKYENFFPGRGGAKTRNRNYIGFGYRINTGAAESNSPLPIFGTKEYMQTTEIEGFFNLGFIIMSLVFFLSEMTKEILKTYLVVISGMIILGILIRIWYAIGLNFAALDAFKPRPASTNPWWEIAPISYVIGVFEFFRSVSSNRQMKRGFR